MHVLLTHFCCQSECRRKCWWQSVLSLWQVLAFVYIDKFHPGGSVRRFIFRWTSARYYFFFNFQRYPHLDNRWVEGKFYCKNFAHILSLNFATLISLCLSLKLGFIFHHYQATVGFITSTRMFGCNWKLRGQTGITPTTYYISSFKNIVH